MQLNEEFLNSSSSSSVPPEVTEELRVLNDFYTTSRAGKVVCDVYSSPSGTLSRSWRPYNLTRGWHSDLWGTCSPSRGWSASGIDASVDLVGECNAEATKCLWVQTFKPGTEQFGASLQSVSVKLPEALTEAQVQSCCFPPTEAARDCSSVEDAVNGYSVTDEDYRVYNPPASSAPSVVSSRISHVVIMALIVGLAS